MAQYNTGTVSISNGSPTVTGVGTLFLANIAVGDIFTIVNDNVWYEVASVDTDLQLTLSANYGRPDVVAGSYTIIRDFTANYDIPYPEKGDIEVASMLKRALVEIDTQISFISSRAIERTING